MQLARPQLARPQLTHSGALSVAHLAPVMCSAANYFLVTLCPYCVVPRKANKIQPGEDF